MHGDRKVVPEIKARRGLVPRWKHGGQAAVEFLLILPLFFFFVLLFVDMGLVMYEYVTAANAVREGARYGAVICNPSLDGQPGCTATEIIDRTVAKSGNILDNADVTVGWSGATRGSSVVVQVNHTYQFLWLPTTFSVIACADMRLERNDPAAAAGGPSTCVS